MNSYINLILDAEGAKERLQRLFQSAPEPEKNAGGSADNKHRCGNVVIPGAAERFQMFLRAFSGKYSVPVELGALDPTRYGTYRPYRQ